MANITSVEAESAANSVFSAPESALQSAISAPKRRGRPPGVVDSRVDPRKQKEKIPFLPKPPFFKAKPPVFFRYWRETNEKFPERLTMYVYRRWPVIDRARLGLDKNIDIVPVPFPEDFEGEMIHRYGSGDYKLMLCDVGRNKEICQSICGVRDPDHPPIINRLEELVLDDPSNRSFIEQLRMRGVQLPGENPRGEDVGQEALAAVLESNRDLTNRLLDAAEKTEEEPESGKRPVNIDVEAASRSMDIIDRAAGMGERIIEKATTKAAEIGGRQQDPLAIVDGLVKIVESMRPKIPESAGPDPMVTALLEEAKQLRDQIFKLQNAQVESLRQELAASRQSAMNPQLQPPLLPGQVPTFQPQIDGLDKLLDLFTRLKKSFGMAGEDETEHTREAPTNIWATILPMAIPAVTGMFAMISNIVYNYAAARMNQQPQAPPQLPAGAYTPEQLAEMAAGQPVTEQVQGQPGSGQGQGQAQGQGQGAGQEAGNVFIRILRELKDPLLKALENGDTGDVFADRLIGWKGRMAYDMLKELGGDTIVQLLRSYPPIWDEVGKVPQKLSKFLVEFLNYDEIMTQQDREDEQEQGQGEGRGEVPEEVVQPIPQPASRVAAPKRKVKTINVEAGAARSAKPVDAVSNTRLPTEPSTASIYK